MEKKFQFFRKLMFLTLLMLGVGSAFAAWDGTSMEKPTKVGNVCTIDSEAKLAWYAAASKENNYTKCDAKLTADLDMGGKLWTPIAAGTGEQKFAKIFDGDNHVIKNLYINGTELAAINSKYAQNLGFVGTLGGGTIKNLILEDVNILASTNAGTIIANPNQQISIGAFVGWMADVNNNVVDNCMVTGTIKTTGYSQGVGGIVGNAKKGTISNCMSLVEIQTSGSQAYIGGIIGITKTDVTVSSCVYAGPGLTNTGSDGAVGGITGNVVSGTMTAEDSYYEGDGITYNGEAISGVGGSCLGNIDSKTGKCKDANLAVHNASEVVEISNVADVACALNGKEGEGENAPCKTEPWSVGETGLSLNGYGIDGYKITFDANGGAFPENAKTTKFLQSGQAITADDIVVPSRDNFSFVGWALTNDASAAENLGTVSKVTTIFAVWEPVYTITFNVAPGYFPGDGNLQEKTLQVAKSGVISVEGLDALPTSYCSVYDANEQCEKYMYFSGWASASGAVLEDTLELSKISATEGLTLYAVWDPFVTYTVTYNANGHGKTTVDYVRVGRGESVEQPTDPVADDGYVFGGWFTDESCNNSYIFASEIHESIVLYAKWSLQRFDITYVLNEGSVNGDNPSSYTVDNAFVLNAPVDVDGYVFEGWFYDAAFTKKATQVIQGTTGDKTFYAKWSKKTYKIAYMAVEDVYGGADDQFKEYGTPIELLGPVFAFPGYNQGGWISSDGVEYALNDTYDIDAPLTLYPTKGDPATYTITYECDGCNLENSTYTINDQFDLIEDPNPREGYRFAWYIDQAKTTTISRIKKGSYGDLNLYGRWNLLYSIDYVCDGCDVSNDAIYPKKYDVESQFSIPFPTTFPEGYKFVGWYKNEGYTGSADPNVKKGSKGNITFYGKLNKIYTITYILNGSTDAHNKDNYTEDDKNYTLNAPAPREGYTFAGWYDNAEFTGEPVTSIPKGSTGDKTFYAKWDKVYPFVAHYGAVTITEDSENGPKSAFIDGDYGAQDKANEREAVNIPDDIVVNSVEMSRTFPVGVYTTIVLPFSVNTQYVQGLKAVLYYNGIKTVNKKSTIRMKVLWAEDGYIKDENNQPVYYNHTNMEANTPYMLVMNDPTFAVTGVSSITLEATQPAETPLDGWTFRGVWKYKEWGPKQEDSPQNYDPETGYAYGFSAATATGISVGDFVRAGVGAWIRPMRAYLVKTSEMAALARANGAYVKRPSVVQEELPEIMSIVIDNGRDDEQTTVIGHFNTRTGEIKMIPQNNRTFDVKGRNVGNKANKARGAYYGKKSLK